MVEVTDANTLLDAIAAEPTMDELMNRDIRTQMDRSALIRIQREQRSAWQAKAKAKEEREE